MSPFEPCCFALSTVVCFTALHTPTETSREGCRLLHWLLHYINLRPPPYRFRIPLLKTDLSRFSERTSEKYVTRHVSSAQVKSLCRVDCLFCRRLHMMTPVTNSTQSWGQCKTAGRSIKHSPFYSPRWAKIWRDLLLTGFYERRNINSVRLLELAAYEFVL